MRTEWQTIKISDACEFIVDCVNKTAPLSASVTPYKMIRTSHIKNGFIRLTDEKCVSEETYQKWTRRASFEYIDVLLTREAPLGSVAMVRDEKNHFLGQRIVQYRSNPRVLDPSYLLYTFLSPALQAQFNSYGGTGSTVDHIRVPDCLEFEIPLPPLMDQKAIAHILGTLDDKIELNRKTNETLEGIAKALFKSWFVDFDPVRAKAEGRPTGLPDEVGELFPEVLNSIDGNDLVFGDIFEEMPCEWKLSPFGDVVDFQEGPGILAKDFVEDGIPLLRLKGIQEFTATLEGANFLDPSKVSTKWEHFRLRIGDILLSSSASIGRISEVTSETEGAIAYTGIIRMRPRGELTSKGFIKQFLQSKEFIEQIQRSASGSVLKHFGPTHLKQMCIICPTRPVLEQFESIFSPIENKKLNLFRQCSLLSSIRDALLPRLISGELRVPDAEKVLEEVGI